MDKQEYIDALELKSLYEKVLDLFDVPDAEKLGKALMHCVETNDASTYDSFYELTDGDLTKDWLQMVYQYYCADRKDKKQDFTPKCLAQFLSRLIGESAETIDLCAGSGALTIQRWIDNPDTVFTLYEIDDKVIPYLLFNLAIRNISATVHQSDVLEDKTVKSWRVRKGDRFGEVSYI